jgi:YesN/AraC family two-component response regulator
LIKAEDHRGKIDLLITDVIMPNMNGNQLAEKVKQKFPEIRVLFMSGYTESTAIQKGILELKTSYLQKPFSSSDLIIKVRQVLDRK